MLRPSKSTAGSRMTPSYFNRLCHAVESNQRGPEWGHWHHTTESNSKLSAADVATLRAEYPPGSATAQQELDASLTATGALFYPEFTEQSKFFVSRDTLPTHLPSWWAMWSGYDWGYGHPAVWVPVVDDGQRIYVLDALYMHREQDHGQAASVRGQLMTPENADARIPAKCATRCYAGHDAFAKRQAHTTAPETVADVFNAYGIHLERASIDREAGAKVIRRLVAEDRLRFVDTVGNRRLVQELAALVPDPKRPNVPLKRDANESGDHGDDGADSLRYALASYPYAVRQPDAEPVIPAGMDRTDWRALVTMTDTETREMPGGMLL